MERMRSSQLSWSSSRVNQKAYLNCFPQHCRVQILFLKFLHDICFALWKIPPWWGGEGLRNVCSSYLLFLTYVWQSKQIFKHNPGLEGQRWYVRGNTAGEELGEPAEKRYY